MRFALALVAALALVSVPAAAQYSSLTAPVSPQELAAALSATSTRQDAVPATGPGPGLCKQTIVPSELVTSGGVSGTAGTCSRILQCGTSGSYVVTQFNVGAGC